MASIDSSTITDSCITDNELLNGNALLRAQSRRVYGRSNESQTMFSAYEQLLATKKAQTVIIHGESGSGKTVLVDMLRNPVFDSDGYFIVGKYVQNAAIREPYSAIMAAFSDLCDLTIQSEDYDSERQQEIALALESHVPLLVRAITNLLPLIGHTNAAKFDSDASSSLAKFKVACKAFLHAVASETHPVVMFLDDIQWADIGSIQLIQMLVQDSGLKNVMFIFAYRDEDSDQVESNILSTVSDPINIALSALDTTAVHNMVTSILGSTNEYIRELSGLVAKRTFGNPLHVTVFMGLVQQEGLLEYCSASSLWIFDIDKMQQAMMVSSGVAELMTRRIKNISGIIKETLKVASILGYSFSESLLLAVARVYLQGSGFIDETNSVNTLLLASLAEAVRRGFVEKTMRNGYQFTHDKVLLSFRQLMDHSEEARLHLLIGEALLICEDSKKVNIYKAAVHLNCVPLSWHNNSSKVRLARINFEAAQYCAEISAFDKATNVLQNGLTILSSVGLWSEEHFELTFEMMEGLARLQLTMGSFEACKETVHEALSRATSAESKINLLLIDVEARMAGNDINDALATATLALQTLGVKIPRQPKILHILVKLAKVKFKLGHKTDEDILNLPVTQDLAAATAVRLLMHVCTYCMLKDQPETAIFSALLATELTLRNGLSKHSPGALTIYGLVEASLGHTDRAYRFGKLALRMLERQSSSEADCPTVVYALTMLSFWREPLDTLADPLFHAANKGFRYGDILYGTFCANHAAVMQIHLGRNCSMIESMLRSTYNRVSDLGQDALLLWLQPAFQYIVKMQSDIADWSDIAILSGEIMDEGVYFRRTTEIGSNVLSMIAFLWKAKLAVDFGQYELAVSIMDRAKKYGADSISLSFAGPSYYCDQARAHFGVFELTGKRWHLRQGRRYKRLLQRMKDDGCPDAFSFIAFLIAQELTSKRRKLSDSSLRAAYEHGLNCLVESKSNHLEGMLCERAGFAFAALELRTEANRYFNRALLLYKYEWRAIAKYNRLKALSAGMLMQEVTDAAAIGVEELYGKCIEVSCSKHMRT